MEEMNDTLRLMIKAILQIMRDSKDLADAIKK